MYKAVTLQGNSVTENRRMVWRCKWKFKCCQINESWINETWLYIDQADKFLFKTKHWCSLYTWMFELCRHIFVQIYMLKRHIFIISDEIEEDIQEDLDIKEDVMLSSRSSVTRSPRKLRKTNNYLYLIRVSINGKVNYKQYLFWYLYLCLLQNVKLINFIIATYSLNFRFESFVYSNL